MTEGYFFVLINIAKYLRVSTKTLRRWEDSGIITSLRTEGGHRRYNLSYLQHIKSAGKPKVAKFESSIIEAESAMTKIDAPIAENIITTTEPIYEHKAIRPSKKIFLRFALFCLTLLVISQIGNTKNFAGKIVNSLAKKDSIKITQVAPEKAQVLAQSTAEGVSVFNVNV
ncbi:MAG: binding domain protein, excisionase family protein, partial [Candidatus Woesebacteria bacterium GW2011_GWB1_38_5b]